MPEQNRWEYRVSTFGSVWKSLKDEDLSDQLNAWGEEGWEIINIVVDHSGRVKIIAKRLLTAAARRQRTIPRPY